MLIRVDRNWRAVVMCAAAMGFAATLMYRVEAQQPSAAKQTKAATSPNDPRAFLNTYCLGCHSAKLRTSGLDLETINLSSRSSSRDLGEGDYAPPCRFDAAGRNAAS